MAIYNGGLNIIAPDISGKEDKSNKVTAWSSTTTDVHYPSEKLVKDALDGKAEKSEIEASVTTDSLTVGSILPKSGSANIGADGQLFDSIYVNNARTNTLLAAEISGLVHAPLMGICNRSFNDWNAATSTGFYAMHSAGNSPGPEAWYFGQVISFGNEGWLLQTAYPFTNGSSLTTRPVFQRSMYNGAWGAWEEVNSRKYGAVFNDLADAIPVGEGDVLEAGYCYGFDGEHYTKTSEYMQKSYIGIHSDTYGFKMGHEGGKEKLNVAVSGFVLACVDKEYEVGTPLTCASDGHLTEIKLEDKIKYPERVIATYWKNEPNEEWGPEGDKIKVNGRKWVKVK